LPALNEGTFAAAMVMLSPVWGFRPVRSALSFTSKVPNPTKAMESPDFKVDSMDLY